MNDRIFVKETLLGTHKWENCNLEKVRFLQNMHHHNFNIYAECDVYHEDREVEFIELRIDIKKYFINKYGEDNEEYILNFRNRSCEMIAKELKTFLQNLYGDRNWKIIIDEDGIQGGIVQ